MTQMIQGKILIIIGCALIAVGLVMSYAPALINWIGKLPGDIRIVDENKSIFIPITSSIVISIILTILVNLFFRK